MIKLVSGSVVFQWNGFIPSYTILDVSFSHVIYILVAHIDSEKYIFWKTTVSHHFLGNKYTIIDISQIIQN